MKKQVLVAGGGIGGLAAALGASRAGWDVRLYERAAAFSEVGAGVQIGPNVVRRLQAWGLQQPLQAVAAFPSRLQVRNAVSGKELAVLSLGPTAVQRYGAAYDLEDSVTDEEWLLYACAQIASAGQPGEDEAKGHRAQKVASEKGQNRIHTPLISATTA